MKLWAISDLHAGHADNRAVIENLPAQPEDWLALVGDLGETPEELAFVLDTLRPRFARLIWVPGNHELWAYPKGSPLRGEAKYQHMVEVCRQRDTLTPEDPYPILDTGQGRYLVAPLFVLYDYSFAPDGMGVEAALDWAYEEGLYCADEFMLHAEPYASRQDWCQARCELTEARLAAAQREHGLPTVLINHFPLVQEHAVLPLIPRFTIWCGTRRTADWHRRFQAAAVVYGHLHIPKLRHLDGVRFHEVSLGYPRQWRHRRELCTSLRQIVPAPL